MGKKVLYFMTCEDETGLQLALEHSDDDDITVLLLQNAVYFANKANKKIGEVIGKKRKVAAAKEDVDVRGLGNYLADQVQVISDSEVIDLVFESDNIINM